MRNPAPGALAALSICLAAASHARAQPATPGKAGEKAQSAAADGFDESLIFDTGRRAVPPPSPDTLSFSVRGEYQIRYRAMTDLWLQPPPGHPSEAKLNQNHYLYHWLRVTPRLQFRDTLALVAQIDVPRGMIVGDVTQHVGQVRDAWTEPNWIEVHPRQLYIEWASPIGLFRVGQQTSHWGMGMLANDGDHPSLFGDYQRGAIVERILYAVPVLGRGTPLVFAAGADLVFEDNTADLLGDDIKNHPRKGDLAFQGIAALTYRTPAWELGAYGVYRNQHRDRVSTGPLTPFTERMEVGAIDVTGKFHRPLPIEGAWIYGQAEAALLFGSTTYVRGAYRANVDPTARPTPDKIQAYGAILRLGVVREARKGKTKYGDFVAELEWGYASGDANPYDGINKRFTMDPNHNVGLLLFDHVLAWKTARAATLAQDPKIVNRPAPGLDFLPSRGGVFGATYLNPRIVVRPWPFLDLRVGMVFAQTTADVVDPYHAGAIDSLANFDGGNPRKHDLGLELDLGITGRIVFKQGTTIEIGAEGGGLLPGHAFDDAEGNGLSNQYLANMKLGVHY